MSASGDHTLGPAHAYLNLVGWATLGLFGVYDHLVPKTAERRLARVHYVCALAGVVLITPGIAMALTGQSDILAKLGSVLTMLSMVIFLYTVVTTRQTA